MSIYATFLAHFYALALSLWMVAVPPGNLSLFYFHNQERDTASEQVNYSEPHENLYLFSPNNHSFQCGVRADHGHNPHDLSRGDVFKNLHLSSVFATAFSYLATVEINFRFIDLIFPYHDFW